MQRYSIPSTPLPFVNGEIAQVSVHGQPFLVSAIWGGSAGARVCFFSPLTGQQFQRTIPDGVPGAYMLKTGPDGRLYLGGGNGDLYRYDPQADQFQPLVQDVMHSITWGGCVTERHVVWSASPGQAAVYDWRQEELLKVFAPLDAATPTALYGHSVLPTPDGQVLLAMNFPQARLVLLDLNTLAAASHTPDCLRGVGMVPQAIFFDSQTLGLMVAAKQPFLALLRYPSLEEFARIPLPQAIRSNQRNVVIDQQFYVLMGESASLWRFDFPSRQWQQCLQQWPGDAPAYMGQWLDHSLCALSATGQAHTYDPRSGQVTTMQLDVTGPLEAHALSVCPEIDLLVGAPFINSRFWTIDRRTGEGQDRGRAQPASGQINQIVWDARRRKVYLSSYTQAALSEFDPVQGGSWPDNPRLIGSAKPEGQMRPLALVQEGQYLWMATSPNYGTLGGALVRFDPDIREVRVWRNLVPDQTPNALVLDERRRRLYASTTIHADCESCPPTQNTAELFIFDLDRLEMTVRTPLPVGTPSATLCCFLPDGTLLLNDDKQLLAWNPDAGTLKVLGPTPGYLRWVRADRFGRIWALKSDLLAQLDLSSTPRLIPLSSEGKPFREFHIVDDEIYLTANTEIHRLPLPPK